MRGNLRTGHLSRDVKCHCWQMRMRLGIKQWTHWHCIYQDSVAPSELPALPLTGQMTLRIG